MLGLSRAACRWSLIPGAAKGWDPAKFKSPGHALEFILASKRMKMAWLAQGTRIPIDRLKSAVRKGIELTREEISKIETYVGVPLERINTSKASRSAP